MLDVNVLNQKDDKTAPGRAIVVLPVSAGNGRIVPQLLLLSVAWKTGGATRNSSRWRSRSPS